MPVLAKPYMEFHTWSSTREIVLSTGGKHDLRLPPDFPLLLQDKLTITRVAYDVGFECRSYFDRVSRHFVHVTPQKFRQHITAESETEERS